MNLFAKTNILILTNCWIAAFSYFHFVSGEKPRCTGQALNPEEFSKEGDVGYLRDLCVDVIARNINNKLSLKASNLCEELANMRTSTCITKNMCIKWKRSYFWNIGATTRITIKAEEMLERLKNDVPKDVLMNNFDDEKIVHGYIDDVESRLINSKAATEDSTIIEKIRHLKNCLCLRATLGQYQRKYQKALGQNDPKILDRVDELVKNTELIDIMKPFIQKFAARNKVQMGKFYFLNFISDTDEDIIVGIPRLVVETIKKGGTKSKYFTVKIPSLYSMNNDLLKKNIFDREVHFYNTLLPKLYQLGNCKPFSATLYAATDTKAFIVEDFLEQGYFPGNKVKQLNLDESLESMDLLATYHALGYQYLQTLSKDDPRMLLIKSDQPALMFKPQYNTFNEVCQLLRNSLGEKLYQKIVELEAEILTDPITIKYRGNNSMTVIIHGDYRTSNILFKKDTNDKVVEAKLINWKLGREANPVLDLIYFFITSVPIDIFKANDDVLKNSYLNKLNEMLSSVRSTRPYNKAEFDLDMIHYKYYYLKVLLITWPLIIDVGPPGIETDTYISSALKWVNYFETQGII